MAKQTPAEERNYLEGQILLAMLPEEVRDWFVIYAMTSKLSYREILLKAVVGLLAQHDPHHLVEIAKDHRKLSLPEDELEEIERVADEFEVHYRATLQMITEMVGSAFPLETNLGVFTDLSKDTIEMLEDYAKENEMTESQVIEFALFQLFSGDILDFGSTQRMRIE